MNDHKKMWEWVEELIAEHGQCEVAAVMGFPSLEDMEQWRRDQPDIDPIDLALLHNAFKKNPSSE